MAFLPQPWWMGRKRMMVEIHSFSIDNSASVRFSEKYRLISWLRSIRKWWLPLISGPQMHMHRHACMHICVHDTCIQPHLKKQNKTNWFIQNRVVICMLLVPWNLIDLCILFSRIFFPWLLTKFYEAFLVSLCFMYWKCLQVLLVLSSEYLHFSYFKKHL